MRILHPKDLMDDLPSVVSNPIVKSKRFINATQETTKMNDFEKSDEAITIDKQIKTIAEAQEFTASPFVQYFHYLEMNNVTIDMQTALQINLFPLIIPEISYRLSTNQNMNWSIFGSPGSGKSLAGLAFYEMLSKMTGVSLKTRNMFTSAGPLYQRLLQLFPQSGMKKDLKRNDTIFVDENVRETSGLGSFSMASQTTEMEIRIRKEMIHFVWVSTVLYPHQSTVILETFDTERDKKEIWKIRRIRLLAYDHAQDLKGSLIIPAPKDDVIDAYTEYIKDKGNETFFSGQIDERAKMLRETAKICLNDPKFQSLKNKEQKFQYLDENFGYYHFTLGQQQRIIGLTKGAHVSSGDEDGAE